MIKKWLTFALCCLLAATVNLSSVSAQTAASGGDERAAKIKADVLKRSAGGNKRIRVKMLNGTALKGFIGQTDDETFDLTDRKTGQTTAVAYREVAQVKGGGLSTTSKIAIGAVAGVAAVVLTVILIPICNEGGC